MPDQLLIDLPEIRLPRDLAWRVKFIAAVEAHVKKLGVAGHFQPPRFFGYYFVGRHPVVLARSAELDREIQQKADQADAVEKKMPESK
jgi:hypothetical protein